MGNRITTYTTLSSLVDLDLKDHKLKDIAILFLNAMNDWPTFNQTEITDFTKELKEYFGTPLTIHKIDATNWDVFNELDVWRHAAGSSIADLIDISTRFCNQSDFDKIIDAFLNYYNNEFSKVDF